MCNMVQFYPVLVEIQDFEVFLGIIVYNGGCFLIFMGPVYSTNCEVSFFWVKITTERFIGLFDWFFYYIVSACSTCRCPRLINTCISGP